MVVYRVCRVCGYREVVYEKGGFIDALISSLRWGDCPNCDREFDPHTVEIRIK
jgi:hypothetical protein